MNQQILIERDFDAAVVLSLGRTFFWGAAAIDLRVGIHAREAESGKDTTDDKKER